MQYFWALVLILIILEYIYIQKQKNFAPGICVLILIILEYIYIQALWRVTEGQFIVLILIILEYIYIYYAKTLRQLVQGLNPYYTGIHLHGTMKNISGKIRLVLILIILEYIYILHKTHETVDKFVS